jgi:hypothetical protein
MARPKPLSPRKRQGRCLRARGLAGYDVALTWRRSCVRIASGPLLAQVAQLGERQTEDLNVPGSSPGLGIKLLVNICPLLSDLCSKSHCHLFAPRRNDSGLSVGITMFSSFLGVNKGHTPRAARGYVMSFIAVVLPSCPWLRRWIQARILAALLF